MFRGSHISGLAKRNAKNSFIVPRLKLSHEKINTAMTYFNELAYNAKPTSNYHFLAAMKYLYPKLATKVSVVVLKHPDNYPFKNFLGKNVCRNGDHLDFCDRHHG